MEVHVTKRGMSFRLPPRIQQIFPVMGMFSASRGCESLDAALQSLDKAE